MNGTGRRRLGMLAVVGALALGLQHGHEHDTGVPTGDAPQSQQRLQQPEAVQEPCDPRTVPATGAQRDWTAVAAETSRVARAELPDQFAGIAIDGAAQKLDVFVKYGADPAVAARVLAAAGEDGRMNWVDRSEKELDAARERVLGDLSWFASVGLQPIRFGPDVRRNVVEVGVRSFTPHHVGLVEDRYGPAVKLCGPEGPYTSAG